MFYIINSEESYHFNMDYLESDDFPMDVYVLVDLSKSMAKETSKLSALGNILVESIRNITSNFLLGYGTITNGFQNKMSLSTDTKSFSVSFYRFIIAKTKASNNMF